jgi:hypothetical protein
MSPERFVKGESERTPFPLIYLRTCAANLLDGICSARSATNAQLRLRDLR